MRNYLFNSIIIVFILYFLIPLAAIAETITLVADEWPPFNAVPNSQKEGLLVDVARTVFEEKGQNYHTSIPISWLSMFCTITIAID